MEFTETRYEPVKPSLVKGMNTAGFMWTNKSRDAFMSLL